MSMDLDLTEIYEVFFEECAEALEVMETGLLGLDLGSADLDTINDIFRAAHSIKGGAGTFGFMEVSSFTHGVETILDQMRDRTREVSEEAVQLLLESVDCIGAMIQALKSGESGDAEDRPTLEKRITLLLSDDKSDSPRAESDTDEDVDQTTDKREPDGEASSIWTLHFAPSQDILQTGNDPIYIFRELAELGELTVTPDSSQLPAFSNLDSEVLYLSWTLTLISDTDQSGIEELFEWVSDQCELTINVATPTQTAEDTTTESKGREASSADGKAEKTKDKASPANKVKTQQPAKSAGANSSTAESASIRVGISKVDSLLNLVGELVITQSMLKRFGESYNPELIDELRDGLNQLERHTRELQESAMQIRMLPIKSSFSRFPRLVRDLSNTLEKKIDLVMSGENTEVDKTVLEKLSDPLVHLVRNSLDHGIEMPEVRKANGKPETGTLTLSASHQGGNVVIEVEDDGAGLNRDRILQKAIEKNLIAAGDNLSDERIDNLIFHPGFSTAEAVSDVSGRGVGMDVVRRNILDLGGRIRVQSRPGLGTTLRISLPLTLAILDGQLVRVGDEVYVISLLSIIETVQLQRSHIKSISGKGEVYLMREQYIPVVRASDQFGIRSADEAEADLLVVVEAENIRFGILVNELLEQQQIVIKSIEKNYKKVPGLTGATILGDGRVALILDVPGLMQNLINPSALAEETDSIAA